MTKEGFISAKEWSDCHDMTLGAREWWLRAEREAAPLVNLKVLKKLIKAPGVQDMKLIVSHK